MGESKRVTAEKTGQIPTHDGQRLHLMTDLGNVHIATRDSGKVSFRIRLDADSDDVDASRLLDNFTIISRSTPDGVLLVGRSPHRDWDEHLSVTFDVSVPRNYNLDISTQAGNVVIGDIQGHVSVATSGGNISTGEIGGPARLVTDGGHIFTKDISGDLVAMTGGGNITTGAISGTAILRTGGGHIRVTSIAESARLETGGGNISIGHSGRELTVGTSGGQIDVGEAAGLIHARTGGGGIRIVRASGPAHVETGSGNVYLTQVENAVHVSTGAGGITAWFSPGAKLDGPCRLEAGEGDIVVYLPRQLPVTVDAQVELGGEHRVIVDPAFPLKVTYGQPDEGSHAVRAEGTLNGGGPELIVRTVSGNIRLVLNDAELEKKQMELLNQQMEQLHRKLEMFLMQSQLPQPPKDSQQ